VKPRESHTFTDTLGGILAILVYILVCAIFLARLGDADVVERILGLLLILFVVPFGYLLISAFQLERPWIYVLQIGLMDAFLIVELLLDYVFNVPFRTVRWQTIAYVVLFFGATGGMIGVAGQAGKKWYAAAIVGFLIMSILSFVQRLITGM